MKSFVHSYSTRGSLLRKSSTPNRLLENVRALVTGASSGIGEAVARSFAKESASVIVNYRSGKDAAEQIAEKIWRDYAHAVVVQGDGLW